MKALLIVIIITGCLTTTITSSMLMSLIFESIHFTDVNQIKANPDIDSPTLDMIKRAGYPAEAHVVQTEDGYLLTLHRIPRISARPVLLQHGLLCSSSDWVITGPNKSLAYLLFDQGYDVWLGNARGNTYSRSHIHLTPDDHQFWNFSFHEMGKYDLPAVITYVTSLTQNTLIYIGHSMGTTMSYVMASERPDIASKLQIMISLAPVAYMNHIKSPLRLVAPFINNIELITRYFGIDEFLPQNYVIKLLAKYGCDLVTFQEEVCENALFAICGFDEEQFNKTWLPIILSHDPAGTSTKTLIHFGQEIASGHFGEYDYGTQGNLALYNSTSPPEYNLTKIQVPIALFYGNNDWLAGGEDVETFYKKLKNPIGLYKIKFDKFNHLDFLWAIDGRKLLYNKLIALIEKYK